MNALSLIFRTETPRTMWRNVSLVVLLCLALSAKAQTPVANRVRAMAARLPEGCKVVAKYTDDKRHCLYYTAHNRLYRYDVLTNKNHEVRFTTEAYSHILNTYITEQGAYVFVCVEKDLHPKEPPENVQELWRISSNDRRNKKIGEGFAIEKRPGCFIIKKVSKRIEPTSGRKKTRWMVQDHYYYLDGRTIWAKEEYEYKP